MGWKKVRTDLSIDDLTYGPLQKIALRDYLSMLQEMLTRLEDEPARQYQYLNSRSFKN